MENVGTVNLKTEAIKAGLISGVVSIVLFLVGYYVMPEQSASWMYNILKIAVGIALAIYFCKALRTQAGGFWSFSQALSHIFIMFLVAATLSYFFTIIFGKLVPEYPVKMKELMMTQMESMFKNFNLPEDQMAEAMAKQSEALDKQFNPTIGQALVGYGITAIFYFIGALIFAAIFKKSQPLFLEGEVENDENFPASAQ